ncbi:MAG TPA: HAD family hydrolase [Spirochaetota bacterium]|nr:HAD family hydrolase [Spirochaetota bacterium]
MIKAVLFDIDGTILNCHGAGRLSLERACADVFETIGRMADINFQGKTDPLIIYESLIPVGFSRENIDARLGELRARYTGYLSSLINEHEVVLLPGIVPLLMELTSIENVIIGLLTGNFEKGASIKLSRVDLGGYFSFGVFGDDTADRNEMPPIAREKIHLLYDHIIEFSDMVVIGDTVHDVECGKRSGTRTIAVGTGWASREELLLRGPDYYFADLGDTRDVLAALTDALGLETVN